MGIRYKFILFLILFYPLISFSQKSTDTLFVDGNYFVKHIVKYNQTIDYIASLYDVSKRDIMLKHGIMI